MDGDSKQPELAQPEVVLIPPEVTAVLNDIRMAAMIEAKGVYRTLAAQMKLQGQWEFSDDNTMLMRRPA